MEMDIGNSRQSSQDYDYTVDGGIPDAQFDEEMNSFLDDALQDDLQHDQHGLLSRSRESQGNRSHHQHDSDYQADEDDTEEDETEAAKKTASPKSLAPELDEEVQPVTVRPQTSSPVKRRQLDLPTEQPFKRKCTELSRGYLDLLNREIRDAALRGCTEDKDVDEDGVVAYRSSQVGLTVWSPAEKRVLLEAVSRLGRSAVAETSALIGSKSIIEVEDYLDFLHHASEERKRKLRPIMQPAERPAAIELSPQCCHALEAAADTLSILQERKEQAREEDRWGQSWNLTQPLLDKAEDPDQESTLEGKALELNEIFDIPQWLRLSSDVFMNSAIPSNNWSFIDEQPPAIWTTAMQDFHSILLSITRRLIQTTIYITMSRLRTKRAAEPRVLDIVRRADVEAAVRSLNLDDGRLKFWRDSARRLRLNVWDDESEEVPEVGDEEEDGEQCMSFDEVEDALQVDENLQTQGDEQARQADVISDGSESVMDDGTEDEEDAGSPGSGEGVEQFTADELAVRNEANEVILFSGVDFPKNTRSKDVLLNRISGEMRQEEYADRRDEQASREGEVEMWEMLEQPVPQVLRHKPAPEPLPRSNLAVEGVYSVGRNWRRALQYYADWEMDFVNDGED